MIDECISGGISGAITDQYSEDAIQYASQKYDSIRKQTGDCERIAKNTGYSIQQINFIKNYLFFDKHYLNSFNETLYKRFDPEFTIAQSWERLSSRKREIIKKHDLLLLKHELKEIECIISMNVSQRQAHNLANLEFNYALEATKYYNELAKSKKLKIVKKR